MNRILLVEDNELNRDMLGRRLRHRGYEVVTAANGRQAVEMARREKPDVVLMDLSLPEIDGWQAARMLKDDADTRGIPVVALTAHAMHGDRERALESGCDEYATKPVDMPLLLGIIARLTASAEVPARGADLPALAAAPDPRRLLTPQTAQGQQPDGI